MAALQIRNVPIATHEVLVAEADRRGQSLQVYLLDVLEREAAAASNRRLLVDWAHAPLLADVEIDVLRYVEEGRTERDAVIDPTISRE